jgi:hypothetical protein
MRDGCASSSGLRRSVGELQDEWCAPENGPHHFALHTYSFSMNDAYAAKPHAAGLQQILLDYGPYISRGNRVQIENVGYLNADRLREWIERVDAVVVVRRVSIGRKLGRRGRWSVPPFTQPI